MTTVFNIARLLAGVALPFVLLGNFAQAESATAEAERNAQFDKKLLATEPPATTKEAPIKPTGVATTATEDVSGLNQSPMLQTNSEELLKTAEAKYSLIIAQGGFPQVSSGNAKRGDKGDNIATLNKRLYTEGYLRIEGTQGDFAATYTSATQDAVARFQRNHGLAKTGKLDAATIAELNIPADKRLATITANIPRLAAYELGLGDRYLVVNIPAQQLEAVSGGRVEQRHNVIVGRPARPSPVVMTPIATVKFNPYWLAPVSLVERDIIPRTLANPGYLDKLEIKILQGGQEGTVIDPKTLDLAHIKPEDYLFRQEPGPENAMATAKIEFNSPFGIYLHDTPEKPMFAYNNRFFSSGCIRVQQMPQLVDWVLNGRDGFDPPKIASMAKTLERLDVPLAADAPQLRVAYLTAWPAANGTVAFRNDIYQLDGTGFTVGQPMPVGELSPDGKRFVLKPLPRAQSIDAAEAEGSGFLGKGAGKAKSSALYGSDTAKMQNASVVTKAPVAAMKKTPAVAMKKAAVVNDPPAVEKPAEAVVKPPKLKKKINQNQAAALPPPTSGLFNWEAYRKQQALDAKKQAKADGAMKKKAKKKVAAPASATPETAAKQP